MALDAGGCGTGLVSETIRTLRVFGEIQRMRWVLVVAALIFAHGAACWAQDAKTRISLTENSNVTSAEIGKSLDSHCPEVVLTADPRKADYTLEAINTGAGPARNPYKFTLFDHNGDRVYSTETSRKDSAVKDVCTYLAKHRRQ